MAMPDFDLESPRSLGEALALLAGPGGAIAMAGGTDLMVLMKRGALAPSKVVSLGEVAELKGIAGEGGGASIGGATTLAEIEADPLLGARFPGVVDAARTMATVQIRHRATLAGNLVTAAACADLAPILTALGAEVELRSTSGTRRVPLTAFFTGARATVLRQGELLTQAFLPAPTGRSASAYEKFGHRRGAQIAVASAAASLTLDAGGGVAEVKLVLGAVAPTPLVVAGAEALLGHPPEGAPLEAACAAASEECAPISDLRGSEAFRRAVVAVVARGALLRAARRAREARP